MTANLAHATHPQRGQPRHGKQNFMMPDSSSDSLIDNNSSVHMKSQGSIKTFTSLPEGAIIQPINFGVKYKPAKLGLEYKIDSLPDQLCIYEVTLTPYIEQGMNTTMIVDLIFDLHREFINPKVIARRQVTRLVDRLLTKVAPDLILNRRIENKENQVDAQNLAAQGTPAKILTQVSDHHRDAGAHLPEKRNLALQLNGVRDSQGSTKAAPNAAQEPLLEQAPESERSDAFSMPVSDGDSSARQGFNQLQNLKMSGKVDNDDHGGLMLSSAKKSVGQDLDNLDINLDQQPGGVPVVQQHSSDLQISEIRADNQNSDKKDGEDGDDMAEMEKLLKSGGAFGGKQDFSDTFKKIRGEIEGQPDLDDSKLQNDDSAQKSVMESDLDMPMHNNSKLLMESPGQNTFVQNQINQLTQDEQQQQQQVVMDENGMSDGQLDLENLTESQLLALQEQAAQQEFGEEDGGAGVEGAEDEDDDDEDVIDVDNPEDLAKKGLRRIQIEGDEQEYLLDNEGNIYNLQGEFVGTTGEDEEEENGSAVNESQ